MATRPQGNQACPHLETFLSARLLIKAQKQQHADTIYKIIYIYCNNICIFMRHTCTHTHTQTHSNFIGSLKQFAYTFQNCWFIGILRSCCCSCCCSACCCCVSGWNARWTTLAWIHLFCGIASSFPLLQFDWVEFLLRFPDFAICLLLSFLPLCLLLLFDWVYFEFRISQLSARLSQLSSWWATSFDCQLETATATATSIWFVCNLRLLSFVFVFCFFTWAHQPLCALAAATITIK